MRGKASARNTPEKKFFVTDRVTNSLTDKLTDSITDSVTESMAASMAGSLTDSMTCGTVGSAVNNMVNSAASNIVSNIVSSAESSTELMPLGSVASSAKPETFNFNASAAGDRLRDGLQGRTECGHQIYLLNRYFTV
jgi:hypothetical protein